MSIPREQRKIIYIILTVLVVMVVGTAGYMLIEGVTPLDALYMTVITISTVGFREVSDLTPGGRIFTIFVIFAGLGTVAYAFTSIATFLLEGEFREILRKKRMENKMLEMQDHFIVCGAGQTGQGVIKRFQSRNESFIVIERNERKAEELRELGIVTLEGDATQEETLEKARVYHAKGVAVCLSSDADNVYTVLTARQMNPKMQIVARALDKSSQAKLRKAGADNCISPADIGGSRIAFLLLRPAVVSFLDVITQTGDLVMDLEEVVICQGSDMLGKTLEEARVREKTGLIVLAIQRGDGADFVFNPSVDEELRENNKLLVLGKVEQVAELRGLACDSTPTQL